MIANASDNPLGNYPTAKLQRSGHATKSETKRMVEMILEGQERPENVIFIPTHGNSIQRAYTNQIVTLAGGRYYPDVSKETLAEKRCELADNLDVLRFRKGEVEKVDELSSDLWIGVCEEADNTLGARIYTYSLVDENFVVQEEIKRVKKSFVRKSNSFAKGNKRDFDK